MADNAIKISEVSEVLRMQLKGIDTHVKFEETGVVISVSDGVVRIFGLRNAESNELLEFDNGMQAIVMNLEEDNVGAILLGSSSDIKEGFIVKRTGRVASIYVGESMLGRVDRQLEHLCRDPSPAGIAFAQATFNVSHAQQAPWSSPASAARRISFVPL